MSYLLTRCPDLPLEPPERKDQKEINNFAYMLEARDRIMSYLSEDDFQKYFKDEISAFFADILWKVKLEQERMDGECF